MRAVDKRDAQYKLVLLPKEVGRGGEILVAQRGKPVAQLISATAGTDPERARRAAEGLRHCSRGLTLGGLVLKEFIQEGRR
jgi:antitoxin (DNA-binding transcriptional repressor) of toxin-antitoxin stability system